MNTEARVMLIWFPSNSISWARTTESHRQGGLFEHPCAVYLEPYTFPQRTLEVSENVLAHIFKVCAVHLLRVLGGTMTPAVDSFWKVSFHNQVNNLPTRSCTTSQTVQLAIKKCGSQLNIVVTHSIFLAFKYKLCLILGLIQTFCSRFCWL